MRKLLSVMAAIVLIAAFVVGGSAVPASATAKQLAFVMPNATHGFLAAAIQAAADGLKREGAKHPDVETRLITAADASEQGNQLDSLINDKVDIIVLWPHNGDDLRSAAQKVIDAGIKLIVFDRLISDINPVAEVDMDNFEYGASAARFFNEFFKDKLGKGEKVRVLEFRGDNSTASTMRSEGFIAQKNANIEIVQSFSTDWQRARGLEYMETFLANNKQADIEAIDGIFSHDSEPTMGIFDAMQNYKGPAKLSNLKAISDTGGSIDFVKLTGDLLEKFNVVHRLEYVPPSVTDYGIAVALDVLSGKEVPKAVKIGYIEITVDNYKDFLANPEKLNALEIKY